MKTTFLLIGLFLCLLIGCCSEGQTGKKLQVSTLFMELPEICPTPDGMAIAPDGNLIVACPNFANTGTSIHLEICLSGVIRIKQAGIAGLAKRRLSV